jgi:hypothetical protein
MAVVEALQVEIKELRRIVEALLADVAQSAVSTKFREVLHMAAQPESQNSKGHPSVCNKGTPVNVQLAAQPEFQNSVGELVNLGPVLDFDALRLVGEWKPLPRTFMRSLHLEFPEFWRRESDAANLARQRAWAAHKVDLAPGTRILVHYGLNANPGVILRSGYGRYDTQYRVQEDGQKDKWIDKWRCAAAVCEDGGGYPETLGP